MMHIIVVNGRHRVGKDSFIGGMIDVINDRNNTYKCMSSIDICKEALKILGWDGTKNNEVRQLLSDLKKFAVNNNDLPTKTLLEEIIRYNYDRRADVRDTFFITQIREKDEIDKLETACNGLGLIGIMFHKVFIVGNVRDNTKGADTDNNLYCDDSYTIIKNNATLLELEEKAGKYIDHIVRGE